MTNPNTRRRPARRADDLEQRARLALDQIDRLEALSWITPTGAATLRELLDPNAPAIGVHIAVDGRTDRVPSTVSAGRGTASHGEMREVPGQLGIGDLIETPW